MPRVREGAKLADADRRSGLMQVCGVGSGLGLQDWLMLILDATSNGTLPSYSNALNLREQDFIASSL